MTASPALQRAWLSDLSGMGSSALCESDCKDILELTLYPMKKPCLQHTIEITDTISFTDLTL